jgi:hypothetical protein
MKTSSVDTRGTSLFSERIEKRFRSFDINSIEPFGKPVVDWPEECQGISGTALIAQ